MKNLIGYIPTESGFVSRFRQHQGWWRAFVLNEEQGKYWDAKNKLNLCVCNRINNGDKSLKNFLSPEIIDVTLKTLANQKLTKSGIIDEDRLFNNLLSSQPLAFNFFGFFRANKEMALAFIKTLRPEITSFEEVVFEYAPQKTSDHSAFDFGFIVRSNAGKGFIGFECKYTDTFSYKRPRTNTYYGDTEDKNYQNYYRIYNENRDRFKDDYFSYIRNPYFNQLFRNELLAVQLDSEFDFVVTGLFCHHHDYKTTNAGQEFQKKIGNCKDDFIILTYADFFERIQKLDLSWSQRELIMLLWARYCGICLSQDALT